VSIQNHSQHEYQGRDLIEDESILGNTDKMVFYAKELIGDLSCKAKTSLDPFVIAKLDIETINHFTFPLIPRDQNKYTKRHQGFTGGEYIISQDRLSITEMAKEKAF
jgi:hypothetical protein